MYSCHRSLTKSTDPSGQADHASAGMVSMRVRSSGSDLRIAASIFSLGSRALIELFSVSIVNVAIAVSLVPLFAVMTIHLKTHGKLALVVRREASGLKTYVHIGTGNYHVRTARLYADVGLFTCNPAIMRDVVNLFHYLTGHSQTPVCPALLVAPVTMRPRLIELIEREAANKKAGLPARIIAKMNQLEDPEMIDVLCRAATAGVPIDLIVRGFCCLRPGVPGRTEGIRIRSIIGRFLEHSRIFHFAAANEDPVQGEFFIGSADWMFRNLSKRVEVVTPILDLAAKARLWEILDISLRDRRQAWVLGDDGHYSQLHPNDSAAGPEARGTHETLMELARDRSE